MKFKGKIDLWLWIVMFVGEAMVLYALVDAREQWLIGVMTAFIYNIVFLPFVIRNYVEVTEEKLTIAFGFSKQSILLSDIIGIYRTNNPISASAASLDRLVIQGENKQLFCSVKNKEQLFNCLREKNPNIVIHAKEEKVKKGKAGKVSSIITLVIMAGVLILLVTGKIETQFKEESFVIKASYWYDKEIDYDEIESLEYRDEEIKGSRVAGFASFKLQFGDFRNKEFGNHTRYTYANCDAGIVMMVNGREIVFNGKDVESTRLIYEELSERCGF